MKYLDELEKRLKIFKCDVTSRDEISLELLSISTLDYINNFCNQNYTEETLPQKLISTYLDRICGSFLEVKKLNGELNNLNLGANVKKVTEGDTSVEYDSVDSSDNILARQITDLKTSGVVALVRHRRLG